MKKPERKRATLVANLGDLNRPLRVRSITYQGREWWAIAPEDTWPGMVMDLRRLGFESVALGEEVLVREPAAQYEPLLEGPAVPGGLKPFPEIHPTIRVRKETYRASADLSEQEDEGDEGSRDENAAGLDEDLANEDDES
ncbi:MAG: hypothetical protein IMW89_16855 [Ktedonobacteraceae bacterium]|nr:hypothetical protein [Ktedonobacteraceae bacterium]